MFGTAAATEAAAAAKGPVVLEVVGAIASGQDDNGSGRHVVRFDRAGLEALPQTTIESYTAWTEGPQTFEGVALKDLLDHVGAHGGEILAVALNDYAVSFPASDAADHGVLLAMKRNGEAMQIRNKGPIWIIYPSQDPHGKDVAAHNDNMVWQLKRLEIR